MKNKQKNNGSITLEACILVPIFIMIMLMLNGAFFLFMGQQVVTHALVQSTKSLALDPYATEKAKSNEANQLIDMLVDITSSDRVSSEAWYDEESGGDITTVVKQRFVDYLKSSSNKADELLEALCIEGGLEGMDFSGSSVEGDMLTVNVKYTQNYIFNAMDLTSFDRKLTLSVNLFRDKTV